MSDSTSAVARARRTGTFGSVVVLTSLLCLAAASWAEQGLRSNPQSLPGIDLRLTFNPGAAFGFAGQMPAPVLIVVVTVVLGLLGYSAMAGRLPVIPSALIFGGGLANLVDRIRDGVVTDYFDLGWWPVFNLPDVAITTGAGLLALTLVATEMSARSRPKAQELDPDPRSET